MKLTAALREVYSYHRWRQEIQLTEGHRTPGRIRKDIWSILDLPDQVTGKSFLDIGANDGKIVIDAFHRGAKRIVACDLYVENPESMAVGFSDEGIRRVAQFFGAPIEIRKDGIWGLEHIDEQFDYVTLSDVIHWLGDTDRALQVAAQVTKGYLHITDQFLPDNDVALKEKQQTGKFKELCNVKYVCAQLEKAGFSIERIEPIDLARREFDEYVNAASVSSTDEVTLHQWPEEDSPVVGSMTIQEQTAIEANGFWLIPEKGWVKNQVLSVRRNAPSSVYNLLNGIGASSLYFKLQNQKRTRSISIATIVARRIK